MPQPTPGYVLVNESSWHRWEPPQYRLAPEVVEAARRATGDPAMVEIVDSYERWMREILIFQAEPTIIEIHAEPAIWTPVPTGAWSNRSANPLPDLTLAGLMQTIERCAMFNYAPLPPILDPQARDNQERWDLRDEYLAWRREPRVDPAAGPEAHAPEPTVWQERRLYGWVEMLHYRPDMLGIGIHEDGSG